MSSCTFSVHDVRFRRSGDDECDILVYDEVVGTVTRRPDIANPDGGDYFVLHLYDDRKGPRQVDDRNEVRSVAAEIIAERGLVPWTPPPAHRSFRERQRLPA